MSDIDVRAELAHWIENVQDADLAGRAGDMLAKADAGDDAAMTDAFFQNLSFAPRACAACWAPARTA